ncbi:DUF771 domain-containing protein [Companilactobacillus musae]|uniref:DUF771 domain-containing protein n=1 Tax=Companilactobacillus musae TaxID=1903258 RepID=UPI000E64AED5|nr:DUF771 domain-containing protein [Companilactobacillus musae]
MQEPKTMMIDFGNGLETYVLTPIDEYNQQQAEKSKDHTFENLSWALKTTGIKSRNTLIPKLERYRDQLDVDNGGCVYFPEARRKPWKFYPKEFKEFIERHKKEFMKSEVI